MTSLECPICGGNDGMNMYGVVVCKAALASANADKAEWQKRQEAATSAESREIALLRGELALEKARADKAERDLGECLAATNEVLKDALEQGKEADAPNQALVKAVRAAYRLGAEEMSQKAREMVRGIEMGGVTRSNLLSALAAIPVVPK